MSRAISVAVLVAITTLDILSVRAEEQRGGTEIWVRGRVTFRGPNPKSSVPDDAGVYREIFQVDTATGGIPAVLVVLTPLGGRDQRAGGKSFVSESGKKTVIVDQQDYAFVPRVVAVQVGQPVTFTNSDAANHNVRSISLNSTNQFNIYTGIGGQSQHRFAFQRNQRPISLGCDIHPWMRGWIYVLDHPLFAVTDEAGQFQIGPVPEGEYSLAVRQPDLRYAVDRPIRVAPGQPPLELQIRAEGASTRPGE